jgi:hypothetical protein
VTHPGSFRRLRYGASLLVCSLIAGNGEAWWEWVGATAWASLGGAIVGNPGAVDYGGLNLFVRGTDGYLAQKVQDPLTGNWTLQWASLGRQATSDPIVAVFGSQLQLWIRGTDGAIWQNFGYFSGSNFVWDGWRSQGGGLYGNPAVGSLTGLFQVVVRGTDGPCGSGRLIAPLGAGLH